MEGLSSQTTKNGQNPCHGTNYEDHLLTFGSLRLTEDGTLQKGATNFQCNIASSSSSGSNSRLVFANHEDTANDTTSKKIKNQCPSDQETSDVSQLLGENSVSVHENIWGNSCFNTADVQKSCKQEINPLGSIDYLKYYAPESYSGLSTRMGSFCDLSSTSSFPNQFNNSPFLNPYQSFRPMGLHNLDNLQSRQINVNGLCQGNQENHAIYNYASYSSSLWDQNWSQGGRQLEINDEPCFVKILKWGDYEQKEKLLSILEGSFVMMMTNEQLNYFFLMLVDACEGQLLNSLTVKVILERELFLHATFCKLGANAIARLIKKLKKSYHALSMTRTLSTRFLDIMTHPGARIVIQQCLILFKPEVNEILYERAIYYYQELATHKTGCRSLNDCINTITGEQRSRLLNHIAHAADSLSYHKYGNYVLQNVLALKEHTITARILFCLKGHYIQLAQQKGGSHVVEKCMESSNLGLIYVVEEILHSPQSASHLAQDHFGNYVIQKALKMTQEYGLSQHYDSLAESLRPYRKLLNQTPGGKTVANLLKGHASFQRPSSRVYAMP